jgi:NAD(P)-dependent dehydrogenase (short-subunit alcohol dehydrogenase family)
VTSKYGVLGLTKSAALDCAPHRIHVNALCPGFVATAFIFNIFTPEAAAIKEDLEARYLFKGLGTPQDVARAAVFLAGEDAAWVTGIALPVDGGYSSL